MILIKSGLVTGVVSGGRACPSGMTTIIGTAFPLASKLSRICASGRPFRVVRSRLLRHGKFCTRECFRRAWKLFSEALADNRLELILGGTPQKREGCPIPYAFCTGRTIQPSAEF